MLQLAVTVLALLSFGLAWFIYRLFAEREYDHELNAEIERAIRDAGWLAEYLDALGKAKEALVKRRER
jgi:hypothetical protein